VHCILVVLDATKAMDVSGIGALKSVIDVYVEELCLDFWAFNRLNNLNAVIVLLNSRCIFRSAVQTVNQV